ncbi:ATP-binding protein [Candidatus Bathyarchaeota archaeon]|nr:ATP-binding protein [Candidatus Bathyarchaeota archaeon]
MPQPSLPNIYIIGAQGTGKTTLVDALLPSLLPMCQTLNLQPPATFPESARQVLSTSTLTTSQIAASPTLSHSLNKAIIAAQSTAETLALSRSSWFISDRSAIDPIVYTRRSVSREAAADIMAGEDWVEMTGRMEGGLVVVCEAGMEWLVDDGLRLMPKGREDWMSVYEGFCEVLGEVGVGYCVLPAGVESVEERVEFVIVKWRERVASLVV